MSLESYGKVKANVMKVRPGKVITDQGNTLVDCPTQLSYKYEINTAG